MDIESTIKATVEEYLSSMRKTGFFYGPKNNRIYDAHPWDINNGLCEDFAETIESKVPGAQLFWLEELDSKYQNDGHCIIKFEGRFYDAECPQGVDKLEEIPFLLNRGKGRAEVIASKLSV